MNKGKQEGLKYIYSKCRVLNHRLTSSSNSTWQQITSSNLVHTMLSEITAAFIEQGIEAADSLFNMMEDRLQLIYLYSTMLQGFIQEDNRIIDDVDKLASNLG